jgi:gamma-tubulin complex component 3
MVEPKKFNQGEEEIKKRIKLDFHEENLVKDLLYVFNGMDGKYIKFNSQTNVHDFLTRLDGSKMIQNHVNYLSEIGSILRKIKNFTQTHSSNCSSLIVESFVSSINSELLDYYKSLSILQSQINEQSFSLRKLTIWIREPLEKMKMLLNLIEATKDSTGGVLISKICTYQQIGDPLMYSIVNKILNQTLEPLFYMISIWMKSGDIKLIRTQNRKIDKI